MGDGGRRCFDEIWRWCMAMKGRGDGSERWKNGFLRMGERCIK
jgi:hypothetical protein